MKGNYKKKDNKFWEDSLICQLLLTSEFDQQSYNHHKGALRKEASIDFNFCPKLQKNIHS